MLLNKCRFLFVNVDSFRSVAVVADALGVENGCKLKFAYSYLVLKYLLLAGLIRIGEQISCSPWSN